jgi:Lecithin retinol acyltransferase
MPEDLPLGAHLTSPRWGYLHHGIYAGGGRVIHYAGFNRPFRKGRVEEVALEQFTRGRMLQVKTCVAPRFSGAAAVGRARSRLGEDRYSFWSNNCEHLATWCISGTSRSTQVDAWARRMRGGFAAIDGWFAARGAARSSAS